jgi:putative endonuclease
LKRSREAAARKLAHHFGLRAETIAVAWLRLKGYRILDRRYVIKQGELDIVALRGDTIAFVEVKARKTLDDAAIAIDEIKRRRISLAARVWLARNPWSAGWTWRGDAIFIAPWRLPRHLIAAYDLQIE